MLRAIVFFLLGIGFACVLYYYGALQWMPSYYANDWNTGPIAPEPSYPPASYPTANYPTSNYPTANYPSPQPAPLPPQSPYQENQNVGPTSDYDTPTPDYDKPSDTPPSDDSGADVPDYNSAAAQPLGEGPPISLDVSTSEHNDQSGGCVPAYTIVNDTSRPIAWSQHVFFKQAYGRGSRDEVILQPGERRIVCASEVYRARDRYPRFDYYRQNVFYGPDASDLPAPLHIRVRE